MDNTTKKEIKMDNETTEIIKALVKWNKEETVKAVSWINKINNCKSRDEAVEGLISFCMDNLEDGISKLKTTYMIKSKTDKLEVCKFYISKCLADKIIETTPELIA